MHVAPRHHYTLDDYFAVEEGSPLKHEYWRGSILAMAGGTIGHNRIVRNVLVALATRLRGGPCEPFGSDMRVATPGGLYTYPDVVVVCGPTQLARGDTLKNPALLVEVLSPSTRDYDRGDKLALYQEIASLREVLFVEPDDASVERLVRGEGGWDRTRHTDGAVNLEAGNVSVPVGELFAP